MNLPSMSTTKKRPTPPVDFSDEDSNSLVKDVREQQDSNGVDIDDAQIEEPKDDAFRKSAQSESVGVPLIVDRSTFEVEIEALRVREKAHTREGDAIAAARRRLPMVEVLASTPLVGEGGPVTLLDTFEVRRLLIAYYFMWHTGKPAPEQCEGCTWVTSQVRELSYIHARDVTYATFCQGPYEESARYRDFMGWEMP